MNKMQSAERRRCSLKNYYQFTATEFRAWLAAWRATRNALEDAKLIMQDELQSVAPSEEQRVRETLSDIETKIVEHNNLKISFYANNVALLAPASINQDKLEQLADNIDQLVGSVDGIAHAHDLAVDICRRFNLATFG